MMFPLDLHIIFPSRSNSPYIYMDIAFAVDLPVSNNNIKTYSIGFTLSATLKSASVLLRTSSTVTPSASSMRVRPVVKSTSKTHYTYWLVGLIRKDRLRRP